MSKVPVLKPDGSAKGEVSLPSVFETPFRPDVIRKAVNAAQANRRQAYGPKPMAGAMHSTESIGKGRGRSRVPRKENREGALAPPTVGGRRAHPPVPWKDWSEKVNTKERRLAIRSAIGATGVRALVTGRGHRVAETVSLPVVADSALEAVESTQALIEALVKMGLGDDLERASAGRHIRAGRGKMRGRKLRKPSSLLIVAAESSKLGRAASNVPGVEVVTRSTLNAERLAPGGDAGRLTVFTEGALKQLEDLQ